MPFCCTENEGEPSFRTQSAQCHDETFEYFEEATTERSAHERCGRE